MNLKQIVALLDLDKIDQNEVKHAAGRRGFFKQAGDFSVKAALATLPLAITFIPKAVKAESKAVADVLNFALTLEYLENEFYMKGLEASTLIPASDKAIFMQISKHEAAHVAFLKTALGNAAGSKPEFDFTAGGMFADAFSNYNTFLALAQSFEDTGVRAYKGQAGNLIDDNDTLKVALQIHSVEARHASEVRRLRAKVSSMNIKGWVTGKESNGAPQAIYDGEDNVTHGGASLNSISSLASVSANAKTEAFDEPLTKEAVLAIVTPFLKS